MKKRFFTYFTKMLFVASFFLFIGQSKAADRYSVATGLWSATSTWSDVSGGSPGFSAPIAGDNAIIEGGYIVSLGANAGSANVTVKTGSTVDAVTFTLAVTGTLTLEGGSTFKQGGTVNAAVGATKSYAATSTYIYYGTQAGLSGTFPTYGNLIFQPTPAAAGTFAGNLNVAGNMTINLGAAFEVRFATGATGRTHSITGNLTIQGSGTVVGNNGTAASAITIGGNLNINAATFSGVNSTGSATFNIAGNITNNSTWQHGAGAGIVLINCNGISSQVISGSNAISFQNLTINNSVGVNIDRDVTVTGALTISPNKALTINATRTLTSSGTFTIQADVTGMGSFIDNGILNGAGTFSVQRWVKTAGTGWEYVSSPIAAASSSIFTVGSHTLYFADEVNNAWTSYAPATMTVMQGYARKYIVADADGDIAKTFTGALNTGNLSIPVSLTATNGWNLVGNPYPSSIDWDLIKVPNAAVVAGSYYVRSNGNYGSYSSGLGTVTTTKNIPPMQAFWVRAIASGTFSCDNSMRLHSTQNIYKTTFDNTLHLTVANDANSLFDDTYIRFNTDATDGFDGQYDAYKMFASDVNYPQVYTNDGTDDIAINNLTGLVGERNVALGFKTTISGQFTLTSDMVSTFTANGNTVYLEDLNTGAYQDLSANSTYAFTSAATTGLNRFVLHFNPTITSISEVTKNEVQLFGYNNQIHIKSLNLLDGDVTVYDILGQVVTSKHLSGSTSEVINLDPKSAVYIVKYTTNSQTITKRIFINQ
jgi:hypothetical protein